MIATGIQPWMPRPRTGATGLARPEMCTYTGNIALKVLNRPVQVQFPIFSSCIVWPDLVIHVSVPLKQEFQNMAKIKNHCTNLTDADLLDPRMMVIIIYCTCSVACQCA